MIERKVKKGLEKPYRKAGAVQLIIIKPRKSFKFTRTSLDKSNYLYSDTSEN